MTPNEYQKLAARTDPESYQPSRERLNRVTMALYHAQWGMSSETGEIADAIKKHIMYGQPLDIQNLVEECGDLMWYICLCLNAVGYTFEECLSQNIEKLRIRYPEKFTEKDALERKDKQ
jgi:NTP pyrophosphatase (non-canonical NTP hydrolase)